MRDKTKFIIVAILAFIFMCTACSFTNSSNSAIEMQTPQPEIINGATPEKEAEAETKVDKENLPAITTAISLAEIPEYSGLPFVEINNNVPFFTTEELVTDAFEKYSPLDSKGRCGVAYANICQELMPTEERGSIGMIKPSGWHTVRYDFVDGKYLYNRCHLIAYQLAGENANERNLITGTRYLNIETMLSFEGRVADYVLATNNHVLYRVTPFFDGDNLLATGVLMEGYSVEDNGEGICYNVFCYNVQPGVVINYANGDSYAEVEATEEPVVQDRSMPVPAAGETSDEVTYIGNKNTKKFHYPYCSSVSDMKEKNKVPLYGTRDEAIAQGYSPCGRCHP